MIQLPKEWSTNANNGNSAGPNGRLIMHKNVDITERDLTISRLSTPITTNIYELKSKNTHTLTKDFKNEIDHGFKTRNSQLPNSHFKHMTKMIKVEGRETTYYHVPGFTTSKKNSYQQREFEKLYKKNEHTDHVATKEMTSRKINPIAVACKAVEKNTFNEKVFEARQLGGRTPFETLHQNRRRIIIKH